MGFCQCKHLKPILLQDAQCSFGTRSRTASWLRPSAEWMAKQPVIPANNEQLLSTNLKITFSMQQGKTSTPNPWHDWTFQVVTLLVGDVNLPQTMASLSIQRMGCWWFCIFHFRVNHYVTQIPISIDLHLDLEQFCWCMYVFKILRYHTAGAYGSIWNMKKVIIPAYVIVWPT